MKIRPSRPWLDRYEHPLPIRSRGAFHILSAARSSDRKPCVIVAPSRSSDDGVAVTMLQEIRRVHDLLDHPMIPKVTALESTGGAGFLELDCDATMDGVDVHDLLRGAPCQVPVACADGFLTVLHQTMRSAHAVLDPVLGRAVCLGRLSLANLLFARSGRFFLVGFGHNFPLDPAGDWAPEFAAPQVVAGDPPSPGMDDVALLLLARHLLPLVDLTPTLARLLGSPPGPADGALLESLSGVNDVLAGASARPNGSTPAGIETLLARLRLLCGVTPDPRGFEELIRQTLEEWTLDARALLSERAGTPGRSDDLRKK